MEWNNFKAPSWDISNIVDEEATLPNIETAVDDDESSTRFGVYYRTKSGDNDDEFSVDLKLGQVGNYHPGSDHIVPNKSKVVAASASSAYGVSKIASSSSFKRARGSNNGILTASCLVDGCNSDLSSCRDYHRRHKVCEQHSKTPEVTIGGFKQRFCQQCSRFHSLEQFDEGKRSCRKRLDGHNRRRRKPQPEPATRPASILSNYQGSHHMLSFSSPHAYSPSAMAMSPAWSGGLVTSSAESSRLQNHNKHQQQRIFLGSSPPFSYNKEETKHQLTAFLHNNNNNNATPIVNNNMFCDSSLVPPRALSLLSPSSSSQTHHTIQMVPHHRKFLMQPLGLSLLRDDDNSNTFESMERVLVVPNNNNNNNNQSESESDHHCCSSSLVYYDNHNMGGGGGGGSDGSQGNEAHHQLFPFQWE